jgi:hypothetical protein
MDCVFELFVLVSSGARGKRRDISLALSVATVCSSSSYFEFVVGSHVGQELATRLAPVRPYTPTVHALILPSQIPIDLRIQFRDLDRFLVCHSSGNNTNIADPCSQNTDDAPEHMNILPFKDALLHVCLPTPTICVFANSYVAPNLFLEQIATQRQGYASTRFG